MTGIEQRFARLYHADQADSTWAKIDRVERRLLEERAVLRDSMADGDEAAADDASGEIFQLEEDWRKLRAILPEEYR